MKNRIVLCFFLSISVVSCVGQITNNINTNVDTDINATANINKEEFNNNLLKNEPTKPSNPIPSPAKLTDNVVIRETPIPIDNHPAPPDTTQPQTEDEFWALMQRFGFMQARTKAELHADIVALAKTPITGWSKGNAKDVPANILAKYRDTDTKKYMNPYPETVQKYEQQSMTLAKMASVNTDFYLDVEYGAKDGRGRINLQKVDPRTLEVLYFNRSGLITNYMQTRLNANGAPPALLRLTHFLFIPPSVYIKELEPTSEASLTVPIATSTP